MITLHHSKAQLADIHISNLYQIPSVAFGKFWNGSKDDYAEYMRNYKLDYNWNVDNIDQLHNLAMQSFGGFEKAINKSIGQFNFMLRSAVKPRNLPPLSLDDYMKLEIDLSGESSENIQIMKDKFLSMETRSFVDFRSIEDNKLIIVYNRRGIAQESDRIAICKSKISVTLKDNFQAAKDNNFIISGILKDIAVPNTEFVYNYMVGNDVKELKVSSNDILSIAQANEANNNKITKTQEEINIIEKAKQEIKQEAREARQSLRADSTYIELTKEGSSNIEFKEDIESTLIDYEAKEMEKLRQRLEKGRELAQSIYRSMPL